MDTQDLLNTTTIVLYSAIYDIVSSQSTAT